MTLTTLLKKRLTLLRVLVLVVLATTGLLTTSKSAGAAEAWTSVRVGLGGGFATHEPEGNVGGFAPSFSVGSHLVAPINDRFALLATPEIGLSWTSGFGAPRATYANFGVSPGFLYRDVGIALTPKLLLGLGDDSPHVGYHMGVRLKGLVGILDLEVAGEWHHDQGTLALVQVGLDPGLLLHMLLSPRTPSPRPPSDG